MSFFDFIVILAIIGIMLGALYVSKLATNKEQAAQMRLRTIRNLRNELVDLDELLHTLLVYDRNVDLLDSLHDRMLTDLNQGLTLLPGSEDLIEDLQALDTMKIQIEQLKVSPLAPEVPKSDRQIFLLKKHFSRASKFIREMTAEGNMDQLTSNIHRIRLQTNSLMLEVSAYRKQGRDAKSRGEINSAASFYKHAKEILVNTELKFDDRLDLVKTISRDISGLYLTQEDDPAA
jgi:hypothetical protein